MLRDKLTRVGKKKRNKEREEEEEEENSNRDIPFRDVPRRSSYLFPTRFRPTVFHVPLKSIFINFLSADESGRGDRSKPV